MVLFAKQDNSYLYQALDGTWVVGESPEWHDTGAQGEKSAAAAESPDGLQIGNATVQAAPDAERCSFAVHPADCQTAMVYKQVRHSLSSHGRMNH